MKYVVTITGRTVAVEVTGERVVVDGEPAAAQLLRVPGAPLCHVSFGGRTWTFAVEPADELGEHAAWILSAGGERLLARVEDERSRALRGLEGVRSAAGTAGATVITAPMPGLVVRVAVAEGQRVDAGTGVVVVEAMKMQNELRTGRSGVVARVHVAAGQKVEKGAPLVTLTPA